MMAYHGNLCVPGEDDPAAFRHSKFFGFDVACVGLGFHHFDDPELAARRLATRLRPGGVLMIIDFLVFDLDKEEEEEHHHHHHHEPHDQAHGRDAGHVHGHKEENGLHERAIRTVTHHGFSEGHIQDIFVRAGVGKDFAIDKMGEVSMGSKHGKRNLFLARGTKA